MPYDRPPADSSECVRKSDFRVSHQKLGVRVIDIVYKVASATHNAFEQDAVGQRLG